MTYQDIEIVARAFKVANDINAREGIEALDKHDTESAKIHKGVIANNVALLGVIATQLNTVDALTLIKEAGIPQQAREAIGFIEITE